MVRCEAASLCHAVVQAGRAHGFHFASTRKSHRSLDQQGWKRTVGRDGRNRFRRRRPETLVTVNPPGQARYRDLDAGWRQVSTRGPRPVVCSRNGHARTMRGGVTDDPERSAAEVIRTDERRWTIEPWVKDLKQLLGLGQDQNRSYRAAVIPRPLVCVAYALLTHLRLERLGAQGQRQRAMAADRSTAVTQDQLRRLVWDDVMASLKEKHHDASVLAELERLRVA